MLASAAIGFVGSGALALSPDMAMIRGVRKNDLELVFRSFRPSDEAFVVGLGRKVFSRWSRDPEKSLASMIGQANVRAIVAEESDEAGRRHVGFAVLEVVRLKATFGPWRAPSIVRLDAIAVDPEKQGYGFGGLLLDEAEDEAREVGGVVMTLMTAVTNTVARALFEEAGYLRVMEMSDSYANGEAAVEMFKLIV